MSPSRTIYTIGHSTRTLQEFIQLLRPLEVQLLLDVRTMPRSRHVPHFNSEALARPLEEKGIEYHHVKSLGGLRKPAPDSVNTGWRNAGFRGFADYMQTEAFRSALADVVGWAEAKRTVLMCAEAVPWRCHRSLIADALVVKGFAVLHVVAAHDLRPHKPTPFAYMEGERIMYPGQGGFATISGKPFAGGNRRR
jgi:uncharacterized protein (DUF488 family)